MVSPVGLDEHQARSLLTIVRDMLDREAPDLKWFPSLDASGSGEVRALRYDVEADTFYSAAIALTDSQFLVLVRRKRNIRNTIRQVRQELDRLVLDRLSPVV